MRFDRLITFVLAALLMAWTAAAALSQITEPAQETAPVQSADQARPSSEAPVAAAPEGDGGAAVTPAAPGAQTAAEAVAPPVSPVIVAAEQQLAAAEADMERLEAAG
jgi:hypothetical protein